MVLQTALAFPLLCSLSLHLQKPGCSRWLLAILSRYYAFRLSDPDPEAGSALLTSDQDENIMDGGLSEDHLIYPLKAGNRNDNSPLELIFL